MGTYDTLWEEVGAQVKLWECLMENYDTGDTVPAGPAGEQDYAIVCPEGFIAEIVELILAAPLMYREDYIEELKRSGVPVYDKWGALWDVENPSVNILGGDYFYTRQES